MRRLASTGRIHEAVRTCGTRTAEWLARADWRAEAGVTPVAMEATGVFGKPVFNLWEGRFAVLLVTPQHIQPVPGRPTDVTDGQGIAPRLQDGLLRGSCVPPRPIRQGRDLTRPPSQVVAAKAALAHRIQKVLQEAHLTHAAVATAGLGVSSRARIRALIAGQEDRDDLADWARQRLRRTGPARPAALRGQGTAPHSVPAATAAEPSGLAGGLHRRTRRADRGRDGPLGCGGGAAGDDPGGGSTRGREPHRGARDGQGAVPEGGSVGLVGGAGPGQDPRVRKPRSGWTTKGDRWWGHRLPPAAGAARPPQEPYRGTQSHRRATRRGKQRAVVAWGPTLWTIIYSGLKRQTTSVELEADFLDRLDPDWTPRGWVKRREKLGSKVSLEPGQEAA